MSVYVGVSMWPFGRMIMCHMFADTEEELDEMAKKLGLKKSWKQGIDYSRIRNLVHYDISKSKRFEAVQLGAVSLDTIDEEADMLDKVCNDS